MLYCPLINNQLWTPGVAKSKSIGDLTMNTTSISVVSITFLFWFEVIFLINEHHQSGCPVPDEFGKLEPFLEHISSMIIVDDRETLVVTKTYVKCQCVQVTEPTLVGKRIRTVIPLDYKKDDPLDKKKSWRFDGSNGIGVESSVEISIDTNVPFGSTKGKILKAIQQGSYITDWTFGSVTEFEPVKDLERMLQSSPAFPLPERDIMRFSPAESIQG